MRGDRCRDRSLISAIKGPIMLITIGILFTLDHFTQYTFWDKTWPVLIIVVGLLSLMKRGFEPVPPPQPPPSYPPPPPYPYPPPPPPQGSYSSSTYAQPGPAKGGFGTTAPKTDAAETVPPEPKPNGDPL
jgi:hypothetical protein